MVWVEFTVCRITSGEKENKKVNTLGLQNTRFSRFDFHHVSNFLPEYLKAVLGSVTRCKRAGDFKLSKGLSVHLLRDECR